MLSQQQVVVGGVVARQRQGWWDWLINLVLLPLRFTVTSATDLFQLLSEFSLIIDYLY